MAMIEHDRQTWVSMLAHLRDHHAAICRQWFEDIEPLGVLNGTLKLRAHSRVHRDYLQRQCIEHFREAAQAVTGHLLSVQFLGPEDEEAAAQPGANGPATLVETKPEARGNDGLGSPSPSGDKAAGEYAGQIPGGMYAPAPGARPHQNGPTIYGDSLVINPDYAFEHFVVGPGNRLAHAAAQAVAAGPGRAYNPYFVHGDVGLGKTHLLQAICLKIHETQPSARIYYTSCEGFMTQFMDAVQAGEMNHFRHKFRDVDVLVIDDIHFLAKRDRTQEEFFHTFNSLYQAHKQIVLSSDAPPEDIPDLEDRLVSRFKWGLVASVERPGYETRVEILKNKARLRGFDLPDDAACYIAAKIDTHIRELEGVVIKLQIMSNVDRRPVDLSLARAALGEDSSRVERPVQIQTIIDVVTDFYGVKLTDLQSKRRHRSVTLPRQVCMYLARKHTSFSLEQIGLHFGGRDHTTAMHAIKTVEEKITVDIELAQIVKSLDEKIRQPA
ncbi:MAG: chromosomal replication initiator protein DnaA [Phycisphaerales bacterium]|nr:chromosomal replication initiator protein DnaA [Phycisphaerales bacterium]